VLALVVLRLINPGYLRVDFYGGVLVIAAVGVGTPSTRMPRASVHQAFRNANRAFSSTDPLLPCWRKTASSLPLLKSNLTSTPDPTPLYPQHGDAAIKHASALLPQKSPYGRLRPMSTTILRVPPWPCRPWLHAPRRVGRRLLANHHFPGPG